jgi:hypothetical protein
MSMQPLFVLIPSPLCGPFTWAAVAEELRRHGNEALVPPLEDTGTNSAAPYWQQHAEDGRRSLAPVATDRAVVLVGHSGAGPLLPLIGQAAGHPVAAYIFVDAGLPVDGATRLEMLASEEPEFAAEFGQMLAAGGRFPTWSDADLQEIVPDAAARQALLAELRPRSLAFWQEPIPVPAGWPDAPCTYLQFSPAYDAPAARALAAEWPTRKIAAGHFHMLVDLGAVSTALLALVEQIKVKD